MPELNFPALDKLIAQFEGYGIAGTRASRNNNPGNLMYGDFAALRGATGKDAQGFAVFPDAASGFQAEDDLLQTYAARGYNLADTMTKWNGNGANSKAYADFVAQGMKRSPLDTLNTFADSAEALTRGSIDAAKSGAAEKVLDKIFGISWSRFAAVALGLICVIAGLLMFKPTQDIIVNGVERAAGVALTV